MDFGKYIKELLMIHDCVILPGLGGFITNYKSAEIHPAQRTIHPPSKQILFNKSLVHNDGLLYAHVSKKSGYGYKEVQSLAEAYINQIIRDVSKGMKFSIEEIGYFYRDRDKQLQFSAQTSSNFLIDSYGLPFVHYQEFESRIISSKKTYRSVPEGHDTRMKQRSIRRIAVSAAAACLAALLVMGPLRTRYFSEAGLEINTGDTFKSPEKHELILGQETGIPTPILNEIQVPVTHHIIVGSFRDFGNARELRNVMVGKGYPVRILAGGSEYYRVSVGQSQDKAEAGQMLAATRSQGYASAWMLSD
jgi:hypothetical protein